MNDSPTRVEQFNSTVRGIVTLLLVAVFCWLAIAGKIDGQVFSQTVASVIAFWFASRGLQAAVTKPSNGGPTTPTP